jgi:hypothetical protein
MKTNWKLLAGAAIAVLVVAAGGCSSKPKVASNPDEIKRIARQAYIYGFPMVLMDITKDVSTAVPAATDNRRGPNKAPINQLAHYRTFPDDTFTDIVSPNVDTLYTMAWLDLSKEPMVVSLPDVGDRYYLFPMLDAWTNVFFSPGTRTTGNARQTYAIAGPAWKGKIPDGMEKIQAPTNMVWILGRTGVRGPSDYGGANYVQDRYKLTPLSQWGQSYTPPKSVAVNPLVDTQTPPVVQVASLSGMDFFKRLAELMKKNPPAAADADALNQFARIGLIRGHSYDVSQISQEAQMAIEQGVLEAHDQLKEQLANRGNGEVKEGWSYSRNLGFYGTNYDQRALVAFGGLGANLDADALYPRATRDVQGRALNGRNRYVIHFAKDRLPPVKGFWSLTAYTPRQTLVKNPIKRYALGDRDPLVYNRDGSLDLYIQNKSPGGKREANWLPVPAGGFNLAMRLYWPAPAALDGTWSMPGIQRQVPAPKLTPTAMLENDRP